MRIMIAGGAGYIGSALIPKLVERGYEVVVVDLLWFGNHLPHDVRVLEKDVFDINDSDIQGFDQVIFLAGLSNDPMAEYLPSKNFIYNAAAPAYLGYISKKNNVKRFIYASSCSVYGYTVNELYDEESPAISNYPYGISKLQGEKAVLQMLDENFSVISLRQGTVSGYSLRMRLDLIVNTMFKTAMQNGEIVVNNPSIWRPVLSIEDACDAYIRSIEASESISGVFNVASDNYTVGEVADLVMEAINKYTGLNVRVKIKHISDYRNYKVSISKAKNVLSFKPRHNIDSIVQDLFDNKDRFKDFDNPNYYNIEIFKNLESGRA